MVKLVDVLGTKYVYNAFYTKLSSYVRGHPDETIDLAGARITKKCMDEVICQVGIGGMLCKFVDTEDPERNKLLEYNQEMSRQASAYIDARLPGFPIPSSRADIQKWLNYDYGDKVWSMSRTDNAAILWATIFQTKRPEVKLYVLGCLSEIFHTFCKYRRSYVNKGIPVMYTDECRRLIKVNAPTPELLDKYECVPQAFGTSNLWADESMRPMLRRMVDDFVNIVQPTSAHLKDFV